MSGICDTCKRKCHARAYSMKSCDWYKRIESNYERLFGTPERAARTMIAAHGECETAKSCYPGCPFGAAPACPRDCWPGDYDVLLGWLEEDS